MSGRLPRLAGVVATVDTAGEGGFLSSMQPVGSNQVASPFAGVADRVSVEQFVLPFRIIIRNISVEITTLDAGNFFAVGIYSIDGNTLLVDTGAVTTGATGVITTAITAVTLEPGVYWFAWTADGTIAVARYVQTGTLGSVRDTSTVKKGRSPNASSAGVLPATLGAVTFAGDNTLAAYFEP